MGAFALVAVFVAVSGGIDHEFLTKVGNSESEVLNRQAVVVQDALQIQRLLVQENADVRGYVAYRNSADLNQFKQDVQQANQTMEKAKRLSSDKQSQTDLATIESINKTYQNEVESSVSKLNQPGGTAYFQNNIDPLTGQLLPLAQKVVQNMQSAMATQGADTAHWIALANAIQIALLVLSVLAALALGYLSSRALLIPLLQLKTGMERVANADLTVEDVRLHTQDEMAELGRAFATMVQNLRNLVQGVSMTAAQLASSSEQLTASAEETSRATEHIAQNIQDMADGSQSQARSTKNVTQTIEEMAHSTQSAAQNALQMNHSAVSASSLTEQGKQSVRIVSEQMESIHTGIDSLSTQLNELGARSKEIGSIVDVMTGIAEQTNLLALNAAIEAARAGDAGRGFAVVADEVRALAEQSASSAKQIESLIRSIHDEMDSALVTMTQTANKADAGLSAVQNADQAFEQIYTSVQNVTRQIEDVTAAVEQMSAGTQEVVRAIQTIDDVTQHNVTHTEAVSSATQEQLATMEEIAASSASLSQLAQELQTSVERFKL